MKRALKNDKVYRVNTANIDSTGDYTAYSRYHIVAVDVEDALKKSAPLMTVGEYAESVELVCVLDLSK